MAFGRQTWTLAAKNIRIVLFRHTFSTTIRAFLLPIIFIGFLAYARNLFIPPSRYGIGTAIPVRSLATAFDAAGSGRDTLVFVNTVGSAGGDIDKVIQQVAAPARAEGKIVQITSQEADLLTLCRNSLRATSNCYGAAVFYASPTEGQSGGMWNYTIRADGALGYSIFTTKTNNDQEIYPLPLQHAIDFTIANMNTTIDQATLPSEVMEYPYTSLSQAEHNNQIRIRYMSGIIQVLAVAFFIGMVGVTYQLVGHTASEREHGLSQLIEAMMPNKRRWEPQAARILASHLAFDIIYAPSWVIIAVILKFGVFSKTSAATLIIFHVLAGLSLSSFSIFGASFFKKAQLSGISTTIISLLLAVLAQVIHSASTGAVAILSLLFPPMTYTFFTIFMARWEQQDKPTNLVKSAPTNPWTLPGIALWVFLIIQIIAFPIFGAMIEKWLYGTASRGRKIGPEYVDSHIAVQLSGFTKIYSPNWFARSVTSRFGKRKDAVVAVNDLNLTVRQGQILVLLGANGSGKSTTLDSIAGLNKVSSGSIALDGTGGLGLCPQKNVLWDELTVEEHVRIFNRLKSTAGLAPKSELRQLILACDLDRKLGAKASTLSGGQKRKLQLAMMFTGGSRVCCVDECSSGVDALARRKLWDILLAERGKRTILFTTHFLDEADLLSDHIAILSKGCLKAEGSAVALKHELGGGYRIHLYDTPGSAPAPHLEGIQRRVMFDQTIYTVPGSAQAAAVITRLEHEGFKEYQVSGPTIEDVFMKVAEEMSIEPAKVEQVRETIISSEKLSSEKRTLSEEKSRDIAVDGTELRLLTGHRIGMFRQGWVLFRKRLTIVRRNYLPYYAAFLIPVVAAGLVTLFLKGFVFQGCSPKQQISPSDIASFVTLLNHDLVVGPSSKIGPAALSVIGSTLSGGGSGTNGLSALAQSVHMVDTLDDFNSYITRNYANVTPGGFFLGEGSSPPTFAYKGNGDISLAVIVQNALDTLVTNVSISTQYQAFDVPWAPGIGKNLQLITYFGLAMAAFPAFFALYPTIERLRNVRALHYSNGVRSLPLWLAYVSFDFLIVLAGSILSIAIFVGVSGAWYYPGYLFVVFFLYGLASILLAYVISLFARSQLAAFAFCAGGQAVMFLLYFIAYISVLTYSPTNKIDSYVNIVHFTIALITPAGNLIRALFVALNVFAIDCNGRDTIGSYPGAITSYGGPILYLIMQSFFLFGILLWWDSGSLWERLRRRAYKPEDGEEAEAEETEIIEETSRVNASPDDGLRVLHLTKAFGSNVAVQNITFGVKHSECFSLLGPNGAGKSTIISLIRGDLPPSSNGGQIFVEQIPIGKRRAAARAHLGVCPQFDAMDQMSVLEHLQFYARIRGVPDVEHNVREVLRAVGLESYSTRMAAKLSGGNKRKLSLGIALMGNPTVLLLDEPSSGMDVCAKRVMWRTLASIKPGRSLVLTTHSMEEADALANRAGIMAKKMLALGTSEYLRRKHGDQYHVHLITTTAPHTSSEEMERIKSWILANFQGAVVEDKTYHGQLRFSVPARSPPTHDSEMAQSSVDSIEGRSTDLSQSGIGPLFAMLEDHKETLGFEYYSVSQTTLDQVFLSIVRKHAIEEENYTAAVRKRRGWKRVLGKP